MFLNLKISRYHLEDLKMPENIPSVRGDLKLNIERPTRTPMQRGFFYRTNRLVDVRKLNIASDQQSLKHQILRKFRKKFALETLTKLCLAQTKLAVIVAEAIAEMSGIEHSMTFVCGLSSSVNAL